MDTSDINDSLGSMALPEATKKAILKLIDVKIDNDMKEVIAEIKQLEVKIQATNDKIQIILWVIGIAMAVMLFIVGHK